MPRIPATPRPRTGDGISLREVSARQEQRRENRAFALRPGLCRLLLSGAPLDEGLADRIVAAVLPAFTTDPDTRRRRSRAAKSKG